MRMQRAGHIRNSVSQKCIIGAILIIMPIVVMAVIGSLYATRTVREQVASANKSVISLYMRQFDEKLAGIEAQMSSLMFHSDLVSMRFSDSENRRTLARANLFLILLELNGTNPDIESIGLYTSNRDILMQSFATDIQSNVKSDLTEHMKLLAENSAAPQGKQWHAFGKNGNHYFALSYRYNGVCICTYLNLKKLNTQFDMMRWSDGASTFFVVDGVPLGDVEIVQRHSLDMSVDFSAAAYTNGYTQDRCLIVGAPSRYGNFCLVSVVEENQILRGLPLLQALTVLCVALFFIIIPVIVLFFRRTLVHPLSDMLTVMHQINDGELGVRMEERAQSDEFVRISRTFNDMLDRIHELNEVVIEQRAQRQRILMDYLQLQINPHFFTSAVNMIYGLAQAGNYRMIQRTSVLLCRYIRHLFNSHLTFERLEDEMVRVRDYIEIMQIRYGDRLRFTERVPNWLMDVSIPHLCIHPFIENACKYALSGSHVLEISLDIRMHDDVEDQRLVIEISDNGDGFSDTVMAEFALQNKIIDDEGNEHIGIWNVSRRLELMYSGSAEILLRNGADGGAVVTVSLPARPLLIEGGRNHGECVDRR